MTVDHGHRPRVLRMARDDQAAEIAHLRSDPRTLVSDTILEQVEDLVEVRSPAETLSPEELRARVTEVLGGLGPDAYGAWVHYPWSRRLVHLLDAADFAEVRTDRNHHMITAEEQRSLSSRVVGVVGLSAGSAVAVTIALERSCGELRLADFDTVALSNLNRLRCGVHDIGVPKVLAAARAIAEIDPYLGVSCFPEGFNEDVAEEFFTGLDLVVEECDSLDAKVSVRLQARSLGIPVLMASSDSGSTDVERFDLEPDRALFHGLLGEVEPSSLVGLTMEQKLPHVVRLVQPASLSPRMRASLLEVNRSISTWPQLASDVTMGGAVVADLARRVLLGEPVPSGRSFVRSHPAVAPGAEPAEARPSATEGRPTPHAVDPCSPVVRAMLDAAVRAPSPGNNQPWHFRVDGDAIDVTLAPGLPISLQDHQHRASVVALGAAIENAVLAAHRCGHRVGIVDRSSGWDSVRTSLTVDPASGADEPRDHDELAAMIGGRSTSRRRSSRVELAEGTVDLLRAVAAGVPGAHLTVIEDHRSIDELGALLARVERSRILSPGLHAELMSEIRFTQQAAEATADGISMEELEMEPSMQVVVELLRDRRTLDLLRSWDLGQGLGEATRRQASDAAAFVVLTVPGDAVRDYLSGGRAAQRVWLAATGLGIAVQPVTSLLYLNIRVREAPGSLEADIEHEVAAVHRQFLDLVRPPPGSTEIMLLRLSHAAAPLVASRRRPLHTCTSVA